VGWLAAYARVVPTPEKTPRVSDSVTASVKNIRNIDRNILDSSCSLSHLTRNMSTGFAANSDFEVYYSNSLFKNNKTLVNSNLKKEGSFSSVVDFMSVPKLVGEFSKSAVDAMIPLYIPGLIDT
jgi:hypothetical protein